jgi:hypothetical protein
MGGWRSYWWVLMILDSLIDPLSVLSFKTGSTLFAWNVN